MKNYYMIVHQYDRMRMDWRPLQVGNLAVRIYTNKKDVTRRLKDLHSDYPKKQLSIYKVNIEILPVVK